jgi:hypothetical protein
VAGPQVHRGPYSGRRLELIGAHPSGRSRARRLAAEAGEASGRCRDPIGGLTSDGGTVRRTGDGGERSLVAAIDVKRLGARIGGKDRSGECSVERRRRGTFYRAWRWWRGGEEGGGGGVLIPVSFE